MVSVAVALVIVPRTLRLLGQAVNVLLEGAPPHLAVEEIEAAMAAVDGVRRVHDLHVWTLTSGREAMSAHVVVADVRESERLLAESGAGLCIEPENPEELAAAVRALADDRQKCRAMGLAGRRYVEAHYDRRKLAGEYEAALAGVAAGADKSRH